MTMLTIVQNGINQEKIPKVETWMTNKRIVGSKQLKFGKR